MSYTDAFLFVMSFLPIFKKWHFCNKTHLAFSLPLYFSSSSVLALTCQYHFSHKLAASYLDIHPWILNISELPDYWAKENLNLHYAFVIKDISITKLVTISLSNCLHIFLIFSYSNYHIGFLVIGQVRLYTRIYGTAIHIQ